VGRATTDVEYRKKGDKILRCIFSERLHKALGYKTPDEVYYEGRLVKAS